MTDTPPPCLEQHAHPVLDPERVAELSALFEGDELTDMWRELVATVTADLERVAAAEAARDVDGVVGAAHSIGGTAYMVGAADLVAAVAEVERLGRAVAGGAGNGGAAIDNLRRCWASVLAAIEAQIRLSRQRPG